MALALQTEQIAVEQHGAVLLIRMNRPEKKNALTVAMYEGMVAALKEVSQSPELKAAVIAGAPGAFTGGNDLFDFMNQPPTDESSPVFQFLFAISGLEKPLIAAVDGVAIGIGTTLLLHCDLAYASTRTKFQMPFVNLGLCPEAGSSLLLPMLVGHRKASEWILLGKAFGAEEAREWGLVNEVYSEEELEAQALDAAQRLAAQPPSAVRLAKQLLKRGSGDAIRAAMLEEGDHFKQRLTSPEAAEAFTAFMEKRKADFSKFS